ncbi:MAG: GGDEF domain-containing protein [Deltaproteobacteria bacterium]|nr:GGDEF domain-containing protein [Deltaproteobacteria bacterium]
MARSSDVTNDQEKFRGMQDNLKKLVQDVFGFDVRFDVSREAQPGWHVVELTGVNYCMHVPEAAAEWIPRLEKLMATCVGYEIQQGITRDTMESLGNQLTGFMGSSDKVISVDGSIDPQSAFEFLPAGIRYALYQKEDKIVDTGVRDDTLKHCWEQLARTTSFKQTLSHGEAVAFRAGSFRFIAMSDVERDPLSWEIARLRLTWLDRLSRERLQNLTDELTGLYSRKKFVIEMQKREGPVTLALINPRHLKMINNIYTTRIGDQLLAELGRMLIRQFSFENCYRLYSGRFGVVFPDEAAARKGSEELLAHFEHTALKVVSPVTHDVLRMRLELQIAIATGRESVLDNATITLTHLRDVDGSMVVYGDTTKSRVQEEAQWVDRLHYAMEHDGVVPVFQGIHNNKTGVIDKFEALMRIDHMGVIYGPFHFMDAALNHGFYPRLTETMIEKTFRTFAGRTESVSINVMLNDIVRPDFLPFIHEKALKHNMDMSRLVIEFVESSDLDDYTELVHDTINQLHEWGAKVAIDDFGSGYANFKYLKTLGVDILKIDGSLISNLDESESDKAIVGAIAQMARNLKIDTIAEFVENQAIQDLVCELGIEWSQGYHFSKPALIEI